MAPADGVNLRGCFGMTGSNADSEQGMVHRFKRRLARFKAEENGGAIVFTLFLIMAMLIMSGYAIDMMRFENKRTRLQSTLDRAVLAAADLQQTLPCQSVVLDYFDKSGLLDEVTSVTCTESVNGRTVEATAALNVNTLFMQGTDSLLAPASGAATESISDVEIALVLDISGSMRSNSKIVNLRTAARDFVATVLANDTENRISISIVPFNAQVNLGAPLMAGYNVTDLNGVTNSNCIDLPNSVFNDTGISTSLAMPQSGYFDAASSTTKSTTYTSPQAPLFSTVSTIRDAVPVCKVFANNIVRLPNRNITTLQSQISGLTADGNTSIYLGMKWGMALLDPGSRTMFTNLIASGNMASNLAGRPFDYDRDNTLKVVVLMTDGDHVSSFILNDGYRTGLSPIYRSTGDNRYSIRFTAGRPAASLTNEYWVPHLCISTACKAGTNTAEAWRPAPYNSGGGVVQQTWVQVWSNLRMQWVAWELYARALGVDGTTRTNTFNARMNTFRSNTVVNDMNTQLQATCAQARSNGVVVFGIAFEAPTAGQTQIAGCSSSPSHYYNAAGLEISTAFRSIATQIDALRLIE